jgi:mitochondrial import inner membrane translocase subunit TIM8
MEDPQLARFVEEMEQQVKYKQIVEKLTSQCWDLCVSNPSVSKFDSRTESCLSNCVERFLDTSTFIVNEFSKKNQNLASSSSFANDSEMSYESFKTEHETPEKPKSSGFKFW